MGITNLVKDYGPAIAWGIIVIGWLINNRQANRREQRKEIRADISDIAKGFDEALDHLAQALTPSRTPQEKAVSYLKITTSLRESDLKLDRFLGRKFRASCRLYISGTRESYEAFFDKATGDKAYRPSDNIEENHLFLLEVHHLANTTQDQLHRLFLCEFNN